MAQQKIGALASIWLVNSDANLVLAAISQSAKIHGARRIEGHRRRFGVKK
jgi:hypothetical protein